MFDIIMLSVAVLALIAGAIPALQSLGLDTRLETKDLVIEWRKQENAE